jgi:hypothetical protein
VPKRIRVYRGRNENVVAEQGQVYKLPAVERQFRNAGVIDNFSDFRICSLE